MNDLRVTSFPFNHQNTYWASGSIWMVTAETSDPHSTPATADDRPSRQCSFDRVRRVPRTGYISIIKTE